MGTVEHFPYCAESRTERNTGIDGARRDPTTGSRGVSVRHARLTISGLAMDQKRAIAALGALAQVSRLNLFRLLLTSDLRGCPLA
jgi:hypothetical protein